MYANVIPYIIIIPKQYYHSPTLLSFPNIIIIPKHHYHVIGCHCLSYLTVACHYLSLPENCLSLLVIAYHCLNMLNSMTGGYLLVQDGTIIVHT